MKRQLASLLVLALCAASPIKAASATFYDVPSSHWAYEDIQQARPEGHPARHRHRPKRKPAL